MVCIVNYGMGNLYSVEHKLRQLNVANVVSSDPAVIAQADKIILPGVGHFAKGMENLKKYDLIDILHRKVIEEKTPVLGICLGMQLITEFSEEGNVRGLGWIKAKTIKFNYTTHSRYKIPHMGWNSISFTKESKLLNGIQENELFYFVHSYYVICEHREDILSETEYGILFTSAIQSGNIYATQFHPEKSHDSGQKILENFVKEI